MDLRVGPRAHNLASGEPPVLIHRLVSDNSLDCGQSWKTQRSLLAETLKISKLLHIHRFSSETCDETPVDTPIQ